VSVPTSLLRWARPRSGALARTIRAPRFGRASKLIVALAVAAAVAGIAWVNRGVVLATIRQGDLRWLGVAFATYFVALLVAVVGWHRICHLGGISLGLRRDAASYALSNLAGRLPGGIWGLVARTYLYRTPKGSARGATAWVAEQVVVLISGLLGLLPWLPLVVERISRPVALAALALVVLTLFAAAHGRVRRAMARRIARAGGDPSWLDARRARSVGPLLPTYVVVWYLGGGMLFLTVRAFVPLSIAQLPTVEVAWILSRLVALLLTVLPTSFGVTEVSLAVLLLPVAPAPVAAVVAVMARLLTTAGEALSAAVFSLVVAWREA
jgi:hypothetical protein